MYNVAIALAAAIAVFVLGWLASGWIAGIIPALIALAVVYILLARRTGKLVEGIFMRSMTAQQAGDIEGCRAIVAEALPLAPWQFLVKEQVESRLGQIDYQLACAHFMEHKYTPANMRDIGKKALGEAKVRDALGHLDNAWSRDWSAQTIRALCLFRLARFDEIGPVMEKAEGGGASEALYWGTWAWMLNEQKKRDEALQVVGRGLVTSPKSKPLLAMQEAFTNKRRPDMSVFGDTWYGLMPEDLPEARVREMALAQAKAAGKPIPAAAEQRRAPPQKGWPQPRR